MIFCHTHTFSCHKKNDKRYKEHVKQVLDKKLESCKWEDDYDPTIHNKPFTKTPQKNHTQNIAKSIYEFAKSKIKRLVVSDNDSNQVFAVIQNNGHLETLDLSSSKVKSWLRYSYYQKTKDNHSDDHYTNAISLIKSEAIHGSDSTRETIYTRIAMVKNIIYYDLATPDWKIVQITNESVTVLDYNEYMPIFVRTQSQLPQVIPVSSDEDALTELVKLLRIQPLDVQIIKSHLISMFVEAYPMPIMAITGEHGSIKSTLAGTIKSIVDPAVDKRKSLPNNSEKLVLALNNRYTICYDNISKINQDISDTLCTAITGAGDSKRALYSNSEEIIYTFKRKIILCGIAPSMNFPDLLDRTITYETIPVFDDQRITEEDFNQYLDKILPQVIGQIFQTLSEMLKLYPTVKSELKLLPRMADFMVFGECMSRSLGYESNSFVDAYNTRIHNNSIEISQTYPIISIMDELIQNGKYEKEVSGFYTEIKAIATSQQIDIDSKDIEFPKSPNQIKGHLKQITPDLRKLGMLVDITTYQKRDGKFKRGCSVIYISKIKQSGLFSDLSYRSSSSSPSNDSQAQNVIQSDRNVDKEDSIKVISSLSNDVEITPKLNNDNNDRDDKEDLQ
jgi:hypothetical protein